MARLQRAIFCIRAPAARHFGICAPAARLFGLCAPAARRFPSFTFVFVVLACLRCAEFPLDLTALRAAIFLHAAQRREVFFFSQRRLRPT